MTTAVDVINVARSQIGYHEGGVNITKYWAELDPSMQGGAWCCGFADWCFIHAGHPLPNMGVPYGYISAATAMKWAMSHGYWSTSGRYSPADLLIFGGGEHTGICVADDGTTVRHIDGNWGDSVQYLTSSHGLYLSGAIKTSRMLNGIPSAPPAPAKPAVHNVSLVKAVQSAVHVTPDGILGDITGHAVTVVVGKDLSSVKYLQARVGVIMDGVWGPLSETARIVAVKRIQTAIEVTADGSWESKSSSAWTVAWNNNHA